MLLIVVVVVVVGLLVGGGGLIGGWWWVCLLVGGGALFRCGGGFIDGQWWEVLGPPTHPSPMIYDLMLGPPISHDPLTAGPIDVVVDLLTVVGVSGGRWEMGPAIDRFAALSALRPLQADDLWCVLRTMISLSCTHAQSLGWLYPVSTALYRCSHCWNALSAPQLSEIL